MDPASRVSPPQLQPYLFRQGPRRSRRPSRNCRQIGFSGEASTADACSRTSVACHKRSPSPSASTNGSHRSGSQFCCDDVGLFEEVHSILRHGFSVRPHCSKPLSILCKIDGIRRVRLWNPAKKPVGRLRVARQLTIPIRLFDIDVFTSSTSRLKEPFARSYRRNGFGIAIDHVVSNPRRASDCGRSRSTLSLTDPVRPDQIIIFFCVPIGLTFFLIVNTCQV